MADILPDLEYLCDYTIFQRQSMIYRASDLISKVIDTDSLVLPKRVMLHVLDNVAHSGSSTDDFDIEAYSIFTDKGTKKFLYNFKDFDLVSRDDLDKFTSRIYRPRMVENVRGFMKRSRKYMIPTLQLDAVIDNKNAALVVNYNPLYRIVSTNPRPIQEYNRYRAIMSTVLKHANMFDNRQNFIVIPVPDNFSYNRSNIMSMATNDAVSSQKLLSNNHFYFLFVELASWLINHEATLPVFNRLTSRELDRLSIMFVSGTKYVIANFGKLAGLVDNKLRAFQFLNNVMSISKHTEAITIDQPNPEVESDTDIVELASDDVINGFSESTEVVDTVTILKRSKNKVTHYGLKLDGGLIATATIAESVKGEQFMTSHRATALTAVFTKQEYRNSGYMSTLLSHILQTAPVTTYLKVSQDNLIAVELYQTHGFEIVDYHEIGEPMYIMRRGPGDSTVKPLKSVKTTPIVKGLTKDVPIAIVKVNKQVEIVDDMEPEDDSDLDSIDDAVKFEILDEPEVDDLELQEDVPVELGVSTILSDKQQQFIKVLESKHRTIKVSSPSGPTTLGAILDTPVDMKVGHDEYHDLDTKLSDKSMLRSSTKAFDKQYAEKMLQRDIIANLVAFHDNGLYLTEYEETNEYNEFTRVKHFKVKFQDVKNKKHTLRFKLPIPDSDGYFRANGVKLAMTKQLVNVPICKISPTRVSLVSNYNKTLVDKVQSVRHSLVEFLVKNAKSLGLTIVPKTNTYVNIKVPYEYKLLGTKFSTISNTQYEFFFEYPSRAEHFSIDPKLLTDIENRHQGVMVGRVLGNKDEYIFMHMDNTLSTINRKTGNVEMKNTITNYLGNFQVPSEWCELKILDKNLPVIFILAYRYGLSNTLKYLKIKHRVIFDRKLPPLKSTELVIKFKDSSLIIDRYPLDTSLIVTGLLAFNTLKRYTYAELDDQDTYYLLLADKGMSTNYLKGISAFFNFFIDPITKDVLTEMGEPTNARDLLIRAVDMLVSDIDREPSSIANFRLRSVEKLPSIVYNEISRQYANYVNSNYKESSFSINTEAIYQRVLQDQTMTLREENNPFHAMKETSRVTYSGFGGRSPDAFIERDRKYPNDAVGILSETTTDSSSAGMTSSLTADPNLLNMRGMFDLSNKNMSTSNVIGDVTLLMPGTSHDDAKRIMFSNVQLTHHIPTKNQKPMRMRTGYELVVPHKTSSNFVARAKSDGTVLSIDDSTNLITVQYKDKTTEAFQYGNVRGESPGMAVNHHLAYVDHLKVGTKVKADEVITYHDEFFNRDPITQELAWCHGVPARVAIMAKDVTLEDSSVISVDFAEKLKFESVYDRAIQITTDMVVEEFVKIGDTVKFDTVLMKLQYADTANLIGEMDDIFDDLKQVEYRSKYEGVVADIRVYHVSDELSEPLTKFINSVSFQLRKKARAAKQSINGDNFQPVTQVPDGTRIKGIQLTEEDVLVVYYIRSNINCGIGDKIIIDSSLKTVVGKVETEPMMTESGEEIDVVFSASSVFNRIILSPIISGIVERIIAHAEDEVCSMYFDSK